MDFGYDDVLPGSYGWGVQRGDLFGLLLNAARAVAIPIRTGTDIVGARWNADGWRLWTTQAEEVAPFDLVVAADGWRLWTTQAEEIAPFGLVVGADGAHSRIRRPGHSRCRYAHDPAIYTVRSPRMRTLGGRMFGTTRGARG